VIILVVQDLVKNPFKEVIGMFPSWVFITNALPVPRARFRSPVSITGVGGTYLYLWLLLLLLPHHQVLLLAAGWGERGA
jgi:hypothetical protein